VYTRHETLLCEFVCAFGSSQQIQARQHLVVCLVAVPNIQCTTLLIQYCHLRSDAWSKAVLDALPDLKRSVERRNAEVRSNISQIQYLYIDIDF